MKLQKFLLALVFAEPDRRASKGSWYREEERHFGDGRAPQLRDLAVCNLCFILCGSFQMFFVANVPCCPLYQRTDVSPGSGPVSKEIIPGCHRNWVFFWCPLLSLTVIDTIMEIKLYFSPWSLLEGRVYPRGCHLPETTKVPLAGWVHATYSRGGEKWSGKSRCRMRGIPE